MAGVVMDKERITVCCCVTLTWSQEMWHEFGVEGVREEGEERNA